MREQLVLIDEAPPSWRLDPRTREVGLEGVRQARLALVRQPADAPPAADGERSEAA